MMCRYPNMRNVKKVTQVVYVENVMMILDLNVNL